MRTTIGRLMIDAALPEDMRGAYTQLDKNGVKKLLGELATKHPEKYRDVAKQLADVGRETSYSTGGNSFGLKDLKESPHAKMARARIERMVEQILDGPGSDDQKNAKIVQILRDEHPKLVKAVFQEGLDSGSPLAEQLIGAGRGNPIGYTSLRGFDALYQDHRGEPIPIPVLHGYARGLRPLEYFAASYGARKGVVDVQLATEQSGYLSKQLNQITHRLVTVDEAKEEPDRDQPSDLHVILGRLVASDDDEDDTDDANAQARGLPVATDDPDNEGALLARPVAGFKRNTILTPRILRTMKAKGIDEILVRSPTVGGPADGGVRTLDLGIREKGTFAPRGDFVGMAASQAISEGVTQSSLASKHTGGVASAAGKIGGFRYLNALVQAPKKFPTGATHAQLDGQVGRVEAAPQGGTYVMIGSQRHYIPPDRQVVVKVGDHIEAGDIVSDGIPHPAEVVLHKGIGEGRRYFVNKFREAMSESGQSAHRRNVELLARGLINYVKTTQEIGDYVPDEVMPYHLLESNWTPRQGATTGRPDMLMGRYLEQPVLHYTIGSKIRPSMVKQLQKHQIGSVTAHTDPPPFEPHTIAGEHVVGNDPDWLTRMVGAGHKDSLMGAVRRGGTSDLGGTSFVPSMAEGINFGLTGKTKGWDPSKLLRPGSK